MLVVAALPGPCGVACRAQGTRDGTCTGAPSCGRRRARSSSGWAGALTRARAVTMVSLPHDPVRAFGCSGSWGGIEGSGETLSPMAVVGRATGTPTGAFRQGWGARQGAGRDGRGKEWEGRDGGRRVPPTISAFGSFYARDFDQVKRTLETGEVRARRVKLSRHPFERGSMRRVKRRAAAGTFRPWCSLRDK